MTMLALLSTLGLGEEPLAEAGEDAVAVREALAALAHGDTRPLVTLPGRAWEAPPAVPDPGDPDLARRWTLLVPAALARSGVAAPDLPGPTDAPMAWDRAWHPAAAELLRLAGRQAWDLGRREDAALLGWAPAEIPVEAPGSARVAAGAPAPTSPRVLARRDWLLGLDPWGRVRWQRRLTRGVAAVGGVAAAVIGPDGAGLVTGEGRWEALPPVPSGTRPMAASAAGAWFSLPSPWRVWWVARGAPPVPLDLPLRTWGAPLVLNAWSCWLDEEAVTLFAGTRAVARRAHGVAIGTGAQLRGTIDDPWLDDGRGGLWRLDGPALPSPALVTPPAVDPTALFGPRQAAEPRPRHDPDGSWWAAGSRIALSEDRGRTAVSSTGADAWSTSWTSPPSLEAPGRHLAVTGDRVVVLEGLRWLTVLDRRDGRRLRSLEAPSADPSAATADRLGLVAWWSGEVLLVADPGQAPLPRPAPGPGALIGLERGILLAGPRGSWLLDAGQEPRPVSTPSWQDPYPMPGGVGDGAWRWPWATAAR